MKFVSRLVRVSALTLAMLTLTACASMNSNMKHIASQTPPPLESSPEAATYKWQPSVAFGWQIHNGFDSRGVLRPDGNPTYAESSDMAQISGRCAKGIQDNLEKIGWVQLRETLKSTTAQTAGSVVGALLGFASPSVDTVRQVAGLTGGTAAGGALYGSDLQLRIIIDSGYATCVMERTKKETMRLGRVVTFPLPLLTYRAPTPLAAGVPEPTRDDMDEQSGR